LNSRNYNIEEMITGVQTLTLKPGDVLAVMASRRLSLAERTALLEALCGVLPDGVRAIVFDEGLALQRLTAEEVGNVKS
jgi:hypothetical protein